MAATWAKDKCQNKQTAMYFSISGGKPTDSYFVNMAKQAVSVVATSRGDNCQLLNMNFAVWQMIIIWGMPWHAGQLPNLQVPSATLIASIGDKEQPQRPELKWPLSPAHASGFLACKDNERNIFFVIFFLSLPVSTYYIVLSPSFSFLPFPSFLCFFFPFLSFPASSFLFLCVPSCSFRFLLSFSFPFLSFLLLSRFSPSFSFLLPPSHFFLSCFFPFFLFLLSLSLLKWLYEYIHMFYIINIY